MAGIIDFPQVVQEALQEFGDLFANVRVVILWPTREAVHARIILVTNRVQWEVTRVVRVYRHRWTGTETFPRDGQQQLGLGTVSCVHGRAKPGTCTS